MYRTIGACNARIRTGFEHASSRSVGSGAAALRSSLELPKQLFFSERGRDYKYYRRALETGGLTFFFPMKCVNKQKSRRHLAVWIQTLERRRRRRDCSAKLYKSGALTRQPNSSTAPGWLKTASGVIETPMSPAYHYCEKQTKKAKSDQPSAFTFYLR